MGLETEANGPNFAITREGPIAHCRIWSRPDLSTAEGAACAGAVEQHLERLASDPAVRALIFDVADAPAAAGPKTLASLARLFAAFEDVGKPVAVIVGHSAMRHIQFHRLVSENAGTLGSVQADADIAYERARAHLRQRGGSARRQ